MNVNMALLAIVKECKPIPKNGFNAFQKYYYHMEADVINTIRPLCVKHGIVVTSEVLDHEVIEAGKTKGGTLQFLTTLRIRFTFTHAETDTSTCSIMVGQGMDSGDKGSNKAITGASKYALMKALMISDGDDAEGYADKDVATFGDDEPEKLPPVVEMMESIVKGLAVLKKEKIDEFDTPKRVNNSLKKHFGTYKFNEIENAEPFVVYDYLLKLRDKLKESKK